MRLDRGQNVLLVAHCIPELGQKLDDSYTEATCIRICVLWHILNYLWFWKYVNPFQDTYHFNHFNLYIEKYIFKYDSRWTGKSVHCFSDSSFSRGLSILFKKELNIEIIEKHRSLDGRRLLLLVKMHDIIFLPYNIYAPNTIKKRVSFFKKLNIFLQNQSITEHDSIIMCGDFNCKIDN